MSSSSTIDWTAVGSICTALALLLGVSTLYWQHRSQLKKDEHDRSKFALDSCLATYRKALELLEDGNNARVTWVTSARMIHRANELSALLTAAPHIAVLEVEKELFRNRAADVLGYENPAKGDWFFSGLDDPSQQSASTGTTEPTSLQHPASHQIAVTELSLDSVGAVFELASFPKNYEEPLLSHKLGDHMGVDMRAGFPGLFNYLTRALHRESGARNEV